MEGAGADAARLLVMLLLLLLLGRSGCVPTPAAAAAECM
jgi:hypothetical protein